MQENLYVIEFTKNNKITEEKNSKHISWSQINCYGQFVHNKNCAYCNLCILQNVHSTICAYYILAIVQFVHSTICAQYNFT